MAWKLSFLAASDGTPLTKHYALRDDVLEKSSYPHTFHFDSHTESPRSLADFAHVVTEHAAHGHCLLKGRLQRSLRHESRANSTATTTLTDWVCLDFDGVPGVSSFEDLLPQLPIYFKDVGYVEQLSASAGIELDKGYSAHVFMLLGTEIPAPQLKEWLTHLNLTTPILRSAAQLNKAQTVLHWPLDITACQNDKLIYIAPPTLEGLEDPVTEKRIRYTRRRESMLNISFALVDVDRNRTETSKLLNERREAAGLPARSPRLSKGDILKDVAPTSTSGEKRERGFCYLNLNDGDSWGYYHPDDKPEILYNFKGEPNYLIKDLLPDYYPRAVELAKSLKEIRKEEERAAKKQAKREEKEKQIERAEETARETGIHYIAINDATADTYRYGTYSAVTNELCLYTTRSQTKLNHFLIEKKQPVPEFFPTWNTGYNFDSEVVFNPEKQFINLYQKTEYLRNPVASDTVPPLISKVLLHAFGDDIECIEHFLNWLACVVKFRTRALSAWVLSGTQGTGKGVLCTNILAPLLGKDYVKSIDITDLQSDFNGFIEGKLLVVIDESETADLRDRKKVMMRLKRLISEPTILINRKGQNQFSTENRASFILCSNKHDPVEVDEGDRRFSVAPRQEKKIFDGLGGHMSSTELNNGVLAELPAFAGYLCEYTADPKRASVPIDNDERQRLKELSITTAQNIANKLKAGDLAFFVDYWPQNDSPLAFETLTRQLGTPSYGQLLDEAFANLGTIAHLPTQHVHILFHALDEVEHSRQARFVSYIGKKGLRITNGRYHGDLVRDTPRGEQLRGLSGIPWHASPETITAWQQKRAARAAQPPVLRVIKNART